ncbi:DEAD/DEAH box helicase [Taylorella equigenitalis]|uniref:DEAD/DEAH box helicase n=1 Tax=Taylorella equigenitalis TaxID=29575 RepID=UPI0023B0C858|nr:DEAD/DEAH box helicase [Taylorella equigenitalis]WEE00244.1 DEAD/DEAH box helicase [Taylorella equigenitalis]WEE01721.1 DEAD/DEAH box helicase [Taylorella equigenitalis]WFD78258.1 DEAD/DEAH box helicase [Taylorella equigenitalis]WFD79736.1 DEAD/DEAH box helicase [Taylorella equigenitalis]WFD81212.1 DEAD/DEAH box helicase [Taylorella equigenitalis]
MNDSKFADLGIEQTLLKSLERIDFRNPTEVQVKSIPLALKGKDLIVSAQTGSGKTAAFMLPSIQQLLHELETRPAPEQIASKSSKQRKRRSEANPPKYGVQILVLTPTRELAMQVSDATKEFIYGFKGVHIATLVGGMAYGPQINSLSREVEIVVATPGRLLDHIKAGRVNLRNLKILILDEADRMLDMGFIHDINNVVAETPDNRQTLLFSATFEGNVVKLARDMLTDPERIIVSDHTDKHQNIEQYLFYSDTVGHKFKLLEALLKDPEAEQVIVFTKTKRGATDLAGRLKDIDIKASELHGDMNQGQRNRTIQGLHKGKIKVLVATDVAARGIDIQGISHVINYDLPMQAEDYVHRIGRTGRAGRDGRAYTLALLSERRGVRFIENYINREFDIAVIPGLEPVGRGATKKKASVGSGSRVSGLRGSGTRVGSSRGAGGLRAGAGTRLSSSSGSRSADKTAHKDVDARKGKRLKKGNDNKDILACYERTEDKKRDLNSRERTRKSFKAKSEVASKSESTKSYKKSKTDKRSSSKSFTESRSKSTARAGRKISSDAPKFSEWERGARSNKPKHVKRRQTKK